MEIRSKCSDEGADKEPVQEGLGYVTMPGSVQFSSVTQSCSTLCDPMNCSTPGFPVQNQLPELTQTHVLNIQD